MQTLLKGWLQRRSRRGRWPLRPPAPPLPYLERLNLML